MIRTIHKNSKQDPVTTQQTLLVRDTPNGSSNPVLTGWCLCHGQTHETGYGTHNVESEGGYHLRRPYDRVRRQSLSSSLGRENPSSTTPEPPQKET